MKNPAQSLIDILDLEPVERDIFRGYTVDLGQLRIFGGQVAAQALMAAGRTVKKDRAVHSLHAYFLRPGNPKSPTVYLTDRIRDGRSFTTRRVIGVQDGEAIFQLQASFHIEEEGVDHQRARAESGPAAEAVSFSEHHEHKEIPETLRRYGEFLLQPFDTKVQDLAPTADKPGGRRFWFKVRGTLPDDGLIRACAVTYLSDMSLLETAALPHGGFVGGKFLPASLDHAMWFHRHLDLDGWLLYDQESLVAHGARGLTRGEIYDANGNLSVSVVQEGLLRRYRP